MPGQRTSARVHIDRDRSRFTQFDTVLFALAYGKLDRVNVKVRQQLKKWKIAKRKNERNTCLMFDGDGMWMVYVHRWYEK